MMTDYFTGTVPMDGQYNIAAFLKLQQSTIRRRK